MNYNFNILPNGVVLQRASASQARKKDLFTSLISLLVAGIAAGYIYSTGLEDLEGFTSIFFFLGGSIGAIGFLVYAMMKGKILQRYPDKVQFNNDSAVVEITHASSAAKRIEIPYSHIKSINPRLHVRRWGSGSDRRSSNWYAVAIYLKDGSAWDLTEDSFSHMDYAHDWLNKWVHHVSLVNSKPVTVKLPSVQSEKLSIQHFGDEARISWRSNYPDRILQRVFPPILALMFASFMGFTLMSTEGPDLPTVIKGLSEMNDFSTLPDLLGGLMFVIPIWTAFALWLIISVCRILFSRRRHKAVVTQTRVTLGKSDLNFSDVGTVSMEYTMNSRNVNLQLNREPVEHYKHTVTEDKTEVIDIADDRGLFHTTTKGDISGKEFFKEWITTIPQQIKEAKAQAQAAEDNILEYISFDRFSPVDVYVIKETIRQKLLAMQGN